MHSWKTTAALAAVLTTASGALAAPITAGDLVVYRVGDGTAALTSAGTAVFLDEYTPTGTLVQSIAQPTAGTGSVVASGTATSEGLLTATPDGKYVTFTGYNTAAGTASVSGTTSAAVNRAVGILGTSTGTASYTFLTDASTGNNPRSALTTDGNAIYFTGGAGGLRYTTAGSTTSTQLSTTTANLRAVGIAGGQLYVTSSSGATRIATVGTGIPTTSGQTITNLPGISSTNSASPYEFVFEDLSSTVAGVDTLYVADDTTSTGGILKYSLVGGSWVATGVITAGTTRGLTASVDPVSGAVTLFGTNGTSLVAATDATGYDGTATGAATTIATAATNEAFRGVAFVAAAPAAVPEPASLTVLGLGAAGLLRRRRA